MKNIKHPFTMIKQYLTKPGMFSRVLVIFCIFYCVRIVEWGMHQFEIKNTEASTLISAGLTLFGGELLLLCLKRIFAKNDGKKIRDIESEIDNVTSSTSEETNSEYYSSDEACG